MKARMHESTHEKAFVPLSGYIVKQAGQELELLQSDPFTFTAMVFDSVPLCQDSCLLNYAALLRQRRREGGLRASPAPTFRRWVVGAPDPLRAPCIQGSPVVAQLAKIVAIRRRGRSGWRMRHCERTKSERASWPGFCQANWANARACAAPTEHRAAASWWALRSLAGLSTGN